MTLDEAIQHCEEKAKCGDQCGLEHAQLAAWLKELKQMKESAKDTSEDKPKYKIGKKYKCWFTIHTTQGINDVYFICEYGNFKSEDGRFKYEFKTVDEGTYKSHNNIYVGTYSPESIFFKIEPYEEKTLIPGKLYRCLLKTGKEIIGRYEINDVDGSVFVTEEETGFYLRGKIAYSFDEIAKYELYGHRMSNRELAKWCSDGKGQVQYDEKSKNFGKDINGSRFKALKVSTIWEYFGADCFVVPDDVQIRPWGAAEWEEPVVRE